ncbi:hypothetical protein Gogos_007199 [Gossypium gossypioides]|uniref:Uncharacterized protein n=1 Tax=Gossypium gossypioides TaxID=34282 RepID=A0A7J9C8F5_GOSGO|nr:hypothetical protein [Gossypium gossypioides]
MFESLGICVFAPEGTKQHGV